jgi:hypothetical protein
MSTISDSGQSREMGAEGARYPTGQAADATEKVQHLSDFLRAELLAADVYRAAIDSAVHAEHRGSLAGLFFLREIERAHGQAAQALDHRIRTLGAKPTEGSAMDDPWRIIARRQDRDLLGADTSALAAFRQREESGLRAYQDRVDTVDHTSSKLIEQELIPSQERNIDLLDRLIKTAGSA